MTAIIWKFLPLIIYPVYLVAAWSWRGHTPGQWLFRIQTLREDDARLTPLQALQRVCAMHWGPLATALVLLVTYFVFGQEQITVGNYEIVSPGNYAVQLGTVLVMLISLGVWVGGILMGALHPRKRCAHDLLTDTKVVYRLDEAPAAGPTRHPAT